MDSGGIVPRILISVLDLYVWSASRPGRLISGEGAPITHGTEGKVSSRDGGGVLDGRKISFPYPESNHESSIVKPVA
jgi:hypothetical protein